MRTIPHTFFKIAEINEYLAMLHLPHSRSISLCDEPHLWPFYVQQEWGILVFLEAIREVRISDKGDKNGEEPDGDFDVDDPDEEWFFWGQWYLLTSAERTRGLLRREGIQ